MKIRIKINKTAKQETSAETVASIDDLLHQILLGLPIRSLVRFKSVSKHWLSLISNPRFAVLRCHNPKPALGLFLRNTCHGGNPKFEYIHFDIHNPIAPPFSTLEVSKDPSAGAINIVQSCGGLLLCSSFQTRRSRKNYYVFNPTTKQSTTIPEPPRKTIRGVGLACDPAKSPAYKAVFIRDSDLVSGSYQIEIYSSETGSWRVSVEPFTANHDFKNGVYWNGAIHWLCECRYDNYLYFNVDEERLGEMPPRYDCESLSPVTYFGESYDHLHIIESHLCGYPEIRFEILEMKRDYSEWFIKYRVDLSAVTRAFPAMVRNKRIYPHYRWGVEYYVFSVVCVIRGEKEEDAFMVLQIPGMAIRYNLLTNTFHKLCDLVEEDNGWLGFEEFRGHQFIESLCSV